MDGKAGVGGGAAAVVKINLEGRLHVVYELICTDMLVRCLEHVKEVPIGKWKSGRDRAWKG